jgi:hypothetical protein
VKVLELPTSWRTRAESLRPFAPAAAAAFTECAYDLEVALRAERAEAISLAQAARESGYTAGHLARLVKRGQIQNAGTTSRPRIRRADLPRKATAVGTDAPIKIDNARSRG